MIVDVLAKEHNTTWDKVMKWEIHGLFFKLDFLNRKMKKQEAELKKK